MAINLRDVESVTKLMDAALEAPDFSFLDNWHPSYNETYFPKLNNSNWDEPITGEHRKKLAVIIDTLLNFEKLIADTEAELSESKGAFSSSVSAFYKDGDLSVVAVPVTDEIKRAMGGYLFAHELNNLPGGEKFFKEFANLLESIPHAKNYLKWRWWPLNKEERDSRKRNAQQLMLTVRTPEERNLLILADQMKDRVAVSNGEIDPNPNDWHTALGTLESLKELPRNSIIATLDFDKVKNLRESIAVIDDAYTTRDAILFAAQESLATLQEFRVKNHLSNMPMELFAQKVKGSRFPLKLVQSRFEEHVERTADDELTKSFTVGNVLALAKEKPYIFRPQSLRAAIRMLETYAKDQVHSLAYPNMNETDAYTSDFLAKLHRVHLDNVRAGYPPRAHFKTWAKLFRDNPTELRFIARSEKELNQLLSTLEHYDDPERIARLKEPLEETDVEKARKFFKTNPAVFQTLLSSMGLNALTLEQISGFLAPDLTKAIRNIEVNTSSMKSTMRSYQLFACQYALHQKRTILGDEMGLGKTVTALGVLAHLYEQGSTRFLITAPLGVLENWRREILKHTIFEPIVFYGEDFEANVAKWERSGGIALATYESLRSANDMMASPSPADFVVVDEAHFIKNPEAKRSKAVLPWLLSSEYAMLLTGTALENHLGEFIQLIQYVQPHLEIPENRAAFTEFRRAIAPAYLRRNQIDVLTEIPEKTETVEYVELSPADVENYKRALQNRDWNAARRAKILAGKNSSTIQRIEELVAEAMENDEKVLIFSFYRETLDILQRVLTDDDPYTPITGDLNSVQRQDVIDKFSAAEKPGVLLAQITSGGTGLNIQAASVVILVEPQVKPSLEVQAIFRTMRMGQMKPVKVYRMRGKGTIDERWAAMLAEKQKVFDQTAGVSDAAKFLDAAMEGASKNLFAEELKAWGVVDAS